MIKSFSANPDARVASDLDIDYISLDMLKECDSIASELSFDPGWLYYVKTESREY